MNAPATRLDAARDLGGTLSAADSPRTISEAVRVFVRHGSPRVLLAVLTATVALRIAVGHWSWWDLAPIAALAVYWPFQEWLIHVYILHYKPMTVFGRVLDFPVPRSHRAHHRAPWDLDLVFIPFHSFLYSVPMVYAIWFAVTPSIALALTGAVAHFALALHYEWVHFIVHTRVVPRTRLYQRLWRNHRLHHFKNEHYWYGVTMLSGDRVLGTAPAVGDVPTSATARDLLRSAA
jgi:hypothetical protein